VELLAMIASGAFIVVAPADPLPAPSAAQSAPIEPLAPAHRLVPVPATRVRLRDDAFFAPAFRRNLETSLFAGHEQLEKNGQFRNFRLAAAAQRGELPAGGDASKSEYAGVHFYDSDAYKWLEAASLALAYGPNPKLEALVDRFIAEIAAAQEPDGYVQTQYTFMKGKAGKDGKTFERWSHLPDDHELYCAGHLIQAAIAHREVTGKTTLWDVALRIADCIDRTFGPQPGKRPGCCGHPEIETALVQLARHEEAVRPGAGKRWLDLALFFLDERGRKPPRAGGDFYRQDDRPIREQKAAAGHAVRQLYLCSGMAGVAADANDRGLFDAALAISRDVDACKLYVTGGIGARHDGEAFGEPFELPNESAYAETCASIALMRFSREMLALTGAASFADRLETTLYNAFLASTGADGKSFFYVNPLESGGGKQRQSWFWCACCPPNVMRTFAGLPGWFASTSRDELFLHLYDAVDVDATLGDGRAVAVRVDTTYPWPAADAGDGKARIAVTVTKAPEGELGLVLRKPAWAGDAFDWFVDEGEPKPGASSGGCDFKLTKADGWLRVRGRFHAGHRVVLDLKPRVESVTADARVVDDRGKAALRFGPVVFAFESNDQPDVDLFRCSLDLSQPILTGRTSSPDPILSLAAVETRGDASSARSVRLTALPYYAWANRGDSKMRIWMPIAASSALALPTASAQGQEPGGPPRPFATFSNDSQFLKEKADVVVLQADGAGPVAVSPKLTGRVMTSAFSGSERGFGLVVRESISKPPVARGFNNYGGEDRLWLAPEGGPYGLYFDPGAKQELANWYVPLAMDGDPRTVVAQDASSISFRDRVALGNVRKVAFDLTVERRIDALSRAAIAELLGAKLPDSVKVVGFRSTNTLKNESATPLPDDALIAPWILGQLGRPAPDNVVLLPFKGGVDAVKKDYFGVVPDDRLAVALVPGTDGGVARFKADSQLRSKIGVSAGAATGWLGSFDRSSGVLTLVNHTVPSAGAIVPDCNWVDPNPRAKAGDVATSYNHGMEPRFFELESIGAAMPTKPGGSVTHVHTTIHLGGDRAALTEIARRLLRADL
jgi:DUF1680 family protein